MRGIPIINGYHAIKIVYKYFYYNLCYPPYILGFVNRITIMLFLKLIQMHYSKIT